MVGTHTLLKSNGYVLPAMKIEEEMNFLNKCIKCKETRSQLLTDKRVKSYTRTQVIMKQPYVLLLCFCLITPGV